MLVMLRNVIKTAQEPCTCIQATLLRTELGAIHPGNVRGASLTRLGCSKPTATASSSINALAVALAPLKLYMYIVNVK